MSNPLRIRRTAAEWAAAGQVIEIKQKISDFEQLATIIEADLEVLEPGQVPNGWYNAAVTGTIGISLWTPPPALMFAATNVSPSTEAPVYMASAVLKLEPNVSTVR